MTSECDSRDLTPEASATRTILSSPTRATGVLLSVTMTPKNAILRGQRKTLSENALEATWGTQGHAGHPRNFQSPREATLRSKGSYPIYPRRTVRGTKGPKKTSSALM